MTLIQKLLLLPCLAPLLAVLLVSGLNLNQEAKLKILTWRTPSLNIGSWIALGGLTGATIGITTTIYLSKSSINLKRQVRRPAGNNPLDNDSNWQENISTNETTNYFEEQENSQPAPERNIRDPYPTVSVPFRIIRHGFQDNLNKEDLYNEIQDEDSFEEEPQFISTDRSSNEENDWADSDNEEW